MYNLFLKIFDVSFMGGLIAYLLILLWLLLRLWNKRDSLSFVMLAFFIICSTLAIADYFGNFIALHDDAKRIYIPTANILCNAWRKDPLGSSYTVITVITQNMQLIGYIFPLGIIYYLFQDSLIAARLFSTVFGILTIYLLFQVTKELYGDRTAKWAAIILGFSPYYWWISIAVLRETFTHFFILWFFWLWLRYDKKPKNSLAFLMVLSLLYLGLVRPQIMALLLLLLIWNKIVLYLGLIKLKKAVLIACPIIMVLAVIIIQGAFFNISDITDSKFFKGLAMARLDAMSQRLQGSSDADSGYGEDIKYTSVIDVAKYSPILVTYFMFSPLPWQVKKVVHIIALMDSLGTMVIFYLFLSETKIFFRRKRKWAIIIFTYLVLGILFSALIQANMGAAVRHRLIYSILLIPFAAHQLVIRFGHNKKTMRGVVLVKA